jgi:hypothetical protein
LILALLGEAIAVMRAFPRKVGADTRARLALWYTAAQALVVAPILAIWMPHRFAVRAASLGSSGVALVLAGTVIGVLVLATLRFGLISLAGAVRRPAKAR